MKTNDLKKGAVVRLRNGWKATIKDNRLGAVRMAEVYGDFTEIGSVYSHDIISYLDPGSGWVRVEYTKAQDKLRAKVNGTLSTIRLLS